VLTVPVYRRFSDLDPLGHVNNVAYHDYLQEARMGMIESVSEVVNADYALVVVSQEVRHRRPMLHSHKPVLIETSISDLGRSSYTIEYRILDDDGELAAEGTTTLAATDPQTGRPIRLPESLLEQLRPHVTDFTPSP
jgi:acyl-CoA thioester hydrolase